MTIGEHLERFAGLPIEDFDPETGLRSPGRAAVRLSSSYDMQEEGRRFQDLLSAFLDSPGVEKVMAVVIGCWDSAWEGGDSSETVEALVSARERLPSLRSLFLGEIIVDESEISWINQSDVSPLFTAFPQLEQLYVRGGNQLSLGRPQHDRLKTLVIETGGMSRTIVQEVASARLPALEHLELWLGDGGYGNDVTPEDLAPILDGALFPRLKYLGLRDADNADAVAAALSAAPVVGRIETLDLSLGTLGDEGARAMLRNPHLARLKSLDLHHHYLSDAMMEQLQKLGPAVNLDDRKEADDWGDGELHRYVAVSE